MCVEILIVLSDPIPHKHTDTLMEKVMLSSSLTWFVTAVGLLVAVGGWKLLNWLLLRPKKLETLLREQGFHGNPYTLFANNNSSSNNTKPMTLSDDKDIAPRVYSQADHVIMKFGKNSFFWEGRTLKVNITNPEHIKEVLTNNRYFKKEKPNLMRLATLLGSGLPNYEDQQWHTHRKIINPAFHLEKLKVLTSTMVQCCDDVITKWEEMLSSEGKCDIDVWPSIQNLACDVISRTAFGSSYQEGKRIFELLTKQATLIVRLKYLHIPGWWLLPNSVNRSMIKIDREIEASIEAIVSKREKAMKDGEEVNKSDLLGILLESNSKEIKEDGMSNREIVEECNTFYLAGQETTADLMVWTVVMLSRYPEWQTRAREEVFQVFGNRKPDSDGLNRLKTVTMILNEVLRLYPPVLFFNRRVQKDIKMQNLSLPAGVKVTLPILLIHHDRELWGDDATEFKPERFSEGIAKATKGRLSYFPFGWGPRICIGQNFSLMEAKIFLTLLLQRFTFELSPAYAHAPFVFLTLKPMHGAQIILHKL
ncbi:11-oxo-beta-amyrin 30-oxidase [Arachis hypogaea]|uniref:11-oxo-beta-amyrin 30-oxidase n=1 Tax=Arachis hypogaea TaxID=3818 RepID=UPI000DED3297|nr:11-oxo-beta-amyrin 30-oxidase [Arachis hypogaea]QHO39404.1 11-oxo-beta-amyrin 30-oxidase [Arachis hypogaea]